MMFRVGLTGGIGSGKSTVAALLAGAGAAVIDTDAIAHALTAPGGGAMPALRARFGDAFVDDRGALDRNRMRAHVFDNPAARAELEAILHPLIRAECDRQAAAPAAHAPYLVLMVPLLVESGHWRERVDRVLVIDCGESTQVERVRRRSGWSTPAVRAVMAAQATRSRRLGAADDVLFNELDAAELAPRVARLHATYCAAAISGPAGVTIGSG